MYICHNRSWIMIQCISVHRNKHNIASSYIAHVGIKKIQVTNQDCAIWEGYVN